MVVDTAAIYEVHSAILQVRWPNERYTYIRKLVLARSVLAVVSIFDEDGTFFREIEHSCDSQI